MPNGPWFVPCASGQLRFESGPARSAPGRAVRYGRAVRTVLITGASSGFGTAAARRFAALGDRVIAAARRTERLTELARELGPDALLPLTLDVRDRAHVERLPAALPPVFAPGEIRV